MFPSTLYEKVKIMKKVKLFSCVLVCRGNILSKTRKEQKIRIVQKLIHPNFEMYIMVQNDWIEGIVDKFINILKHVRNIIKIDFMD